MTRRLFTLAALLSLSLCLATAALWVRSYRRGDSIAVTDLSQFSCYLELNSYWGRTNAMLITFGHHGDSPSHSENWRRYGVTYQPKSARGPGCSPDRRPTRPHFFFDRETERFLDRAAYSAWMEVPDWFLVCLFAVLPSMSLVCSGWRRLRRRAGFCLACGYDLRATPNRCPECGEIPAEAKP